ncbi:hypothetical protein DWY73_10275 [Bacteroides fragilis]|uniref:Uncharacterized protein n=3 Tax=Bacteroides fragilis TaxID=817 RepID=A0A3E5I9L2_BACFG|nr:hypothetical protein F3B28_11120 [Bacteroides fragilis]CBW21558.1 conserved hypothetical protein [Bacteroides fragilis 638R]BAD47761.1 hypothetical protein BF1011 [Bacteroides fragilis YCH46]KAA4708571.1 hypothetical protein F3B27_09945 [Bacteroides fragilis]KAA4717904.1 hypothetical protein F3B32_12885 [Bacteroides fragilis]
MNKATSHLIINLLTAPTRKKKKSKITYCKQKRKRKTCPKQIKAVILCPDYSAPGLSKCFLSD